MKNFKNTTCFYCIQVFLFVVILIGSSSCVFQKNKKTHVQGEYIYRKSNEFFFTLPEQNPQALPRYPWEETYVGGHPRITKEFFRCKGHALNPVVIQTREGKESLSYYDCSGKHGLPLKDEKEFVFPCLLELLNYIQEQTGKKVVVTSGHRCPQHNLYLDHTSYNWSSKHMLGAEVDFYVEGYETEPQKILELIQACYKEKFTEKAYTQFERYEKSGINVSTPPWMNKEVFIKLYLPHEGRNCDNTHDFPYIGIQVRFDRDTQNKVTFDAAASQNYLRY